MEEKLIEAVQKKELLYNKSSLLYRNKVKRAEAWSAISKELNLPEDVCQARWKLLRDKYVKMNAESLHPSGSGVEIPETYWKYQNQMEFLREHIKPRRTVTSLTQDEVLNMEVSPTVVLNEEHTQSVESLTEATSESDAPSSSRKRKRRESDSGAAFSEFLDKMANIAEKRFAAPPAPTRPESRPHDAFFNMVDEIFDEMSADSVRDAKFHILEYLREQIKSKSSLC